MKTYTPEQNVANFIKAGIRKVNEAETTLRRTQNFWKGSDGLIWMCKQNQLTLDEIKPFLPEEFNDVFEEAKIKLS